MTPLGHHSEFKTKGSLGRPILDFLIFEIFKLGLRDSFSETIKWFSKSSWSQVMGPILNSLKNQNWANVLKIVGSSFNLGSGIFIRGWRWQLVVEAQSFFFSFFFDHVLFIGCCYLLHHHHCFCDFLLILMFMNFFPYCNSHWWLWCSSCCCNPLLPSYTIIFFTFL